MSQPVPTPGPGRPFRRQDALAAGIAPAELRGRRYQSVLHGVLLDAAVEPTLAVRAAAALLLAPSGSGLTHHTAARLWGAVVPDHPDLHLGVPRSTRLRTDGVRVHRYAVLPRWQRRRGLPVTSPERTFLDLAATLPLVDLVVLGDSLVRRMATTPPRLVAAAAGASGRWCSLARRAAALVRPGVDSPQETRLRLLLVLAGLPEPETNHIVRGERGEWLRRFELAYRGVLLAFEYDGRHHIAREEQWSADVVRREEVEGGRLAGEEWRLLTFVAADLHISPAATLERMVFALRRRGIRAAVRSQEWRRHFPVRDG